MIFDNFSVWAESSDTRSRILAVKALCESYICSGFNADEMKAAEGAMILLLDDPSSEVRKAMASSLCAHEDVPIIVINALAQDQLDVSAPVLAYSPLLSDNNLIDLVADGLLEHRFIVSQRKYISPAVCAALIEIGEKEVVSELLQNSGSQIACLSLVRIAERFGQAGEIRNELLNRNDIPAHIRYELVEQLGQVLAKDSLLSALMGEKRASYVTKDACDQAALSVIERTSDDDMEALIEHLRFSGKITSALLMNVLSVGNVDFFAMVISKLSGKGVSRIRAILRDGHFSLVKALYKSAGLSPELIPIFIDATLLWRDASHQSDIVLADEIVAKLLDKYQDQVRSQSSVAELLMMMENTRFKQCRRVAKSYAMSLVKQAA
ncbi:DUF2336 domain-containing protein [Lentilitoribacter sp. Alg239-R112]|uniref:DUF2336 domain-containing protein n=1 Tax=Lentilitoribacter sp. Alg239-R112 TaxID=2305987 RepID=UPI0013A6ED87|nr:DUF2336 domain-containing protein [Lentilitoribacter sp. Alg239-R112]